MGCGCKVFFYSVLGFFGFFFLSVSFSIFGFAVSCFMKECTCTFIEIEEEF